MSGEVRLSGRLICATASEAAVVRRHLPDHLRLTRAEPGCLSFSVEPTDNPLIWQVDECFADRNAFAEHQNRSQTSVWANVTAGIARDYQVEGMD